MVVVVPAVDRIRALKALDSAYTHFGGDAIVSLHILTDDDNDIEPIFNPKLVPLSERYV